jgi:hypothetical protein
VSKSDKDERVLPDPPPAWARDFFPTSYIAAEDLKGQDVTLTISAVKRELLQRPGKKSEKKWCLWFQEMEERHARDSEKPNKRLVLNKTNLDLIADQHGKKPADWVGKQITLTPSRCEAFGETVPCVRVKKGKR